MSEGRKRALEEDESDEEYQEPRGRKRTTAPAAQRKPRGRVVSREEDETNASEQLDADSDSPESLNKTPSPSLGKSSIDSSGKNGDEANADLEINRDTAQVLDQGVEEAQAEPTHSPQELSDQESHLPANENVETTQNMDLLSNPEPVLESERSDAEAQSDVVLHEEGVSANEAKDGEFEPHSSRESDLEQELQSEPSSDSNAEAKHSTRAERKDNLHHISDPKDKKRASSATAPQDDDSDQEVERIPDLRVARPEMPSIDDYLPIPFPHKYTSQEPPAPPDPSKVTVMEWIREQQTYLLDTMRDRIEQRLASIRRRNLQERKRLEKKLRSQ